MPESIELNGFTPTEPYHPATKQFVETEIADAVADVVIPAIAPTEGDGLKFISGEWVPTPIESGGGGSDLVYFI